jgi:hypothetical protein
MNINALKSHDQAVGGAIARFDWLITRDRVKSSSSTKAAEHAVDQHLPEA